MAWHVNGSTDYDVLDVLGLLPEIITDKDSRPVREQIEDRYAHGGGWKPMEGFTFDPMSATLTYKDGEQMLALAYAAVRNEVVVLYESAILLVFNRTDNTYDVIRID